MNNEKIIEILDKLNYSQLIQVCRVVLLYINQTYYEIDNIPEDLIHIVDMCFNRYNPFIGAVDVKELLDYVTFRGNKEGHSISEQEFEKLLSDFLS